MKPRSTLLPPYTAGPPSRTPRTIANAASLSPELGLECFRASRTAVVQKVQGASPRTNGAASARNAKVRRAGRKLAASSSLAAKVPKRLYLESWYQIIESKVFTAL